MRNKISSVSREKGTVLISHGSLSSQFQCFFHFSLGIAHLLAFSLIMEILALCQGNFEFGSAILEIHSRGNKGVALGCHFFVKLLDFILVQQQLAVSFLVHIEDISLLVVGDVHSLDPCLAISDRDVGILELHTAIAHRLDFGASQSNAAFILVFQEVVVARPSVVNDCLFAISVSFCH